MLNHAPKATSKRVFSRRKQSRPTKMKHLISPLISTTTQLATLPVSSFNIPVSNKLKHNTLCGFSTSTIDVPEDVEKERVSVIAGERVFHRFEVTLDPPTLEETPEMNSSQKDKRWVIPDRPNPTLTKIAYLNKNLHIQPKPAISDSNLPEFIPNLNSPAFSDDLFRTDPVPNSFDSSIFPTDSLNMNQNTPKLRRKFGHMPYQTGEGQTHCDDLEGDDDGDDDYYGGISLDDKLKHFQAEQEHIIPHYSSATSSKRTVPTQSCEFRSKMDEQYHYLAAPDSAFFDSVDPSVGKAMKHAKRAKHEEFRDNLKKKSKFESEQELEAQRKADEALAEDIDFEPIENDIENNITQIQALSAYIMQKKAESGNFHPSQRPVFWHGVMPHANNIAIQGLQQFEKEMIDLDWRTFLDLSQPHLWFPTARLLKRKIILHCGPTNSGKTYRAMQRLKEAESGLYCGPLRLLAWENYEKLNAQNIPASLLTGQEVIETPNAKHVSSTVEMVNLDRIVDVAVIDEIQMIQDIDRGHAWTRAFLGIPAKEVHLCGDATSLQWLQEITKLTGEELHICEYKRLSPLTVQAQPTSSYKYLKKGDCVVAFSRNDVYAIKKKIEEETNRKVSIIYGNLPPDIRKEQARSFNDGESDILVASDAIGMGLNLNIGRVIFSTICKFDGTEFRRLNKTEVLQIAGRAGRFNTQFHNGQVSVMHVPEDLEYIREQFQTPLPPMEKAILFPTTEHLLTFCERFPKVKLSDYLRSLNSRAKVGDLFKICDVRNTADLAEVVDEIEMPSYNRVMLCYAPLSIDRYKSHRPLLLELAQKLIEDEPIPVPKIAYCARPVMPRTPAEVALLEETFSNLEAYIWLWFRMGDQMYMHRQAKLDRESCQRIILQYLQTNSHSYTKNSHFKNHSQSETKQLTSQQSISQKEHQQSEKRE